MREGMEFGRDPSMEMGHEKAETDEAIAEAKEKMGALPVGIAESITREPASLGAVERSPGKSIAMPEAEPKFSLMAREVEESARTGEPIVLEQEESAEEREFDPERHEWELSRKVKDLLEGEQVRTAIEDFISSIHPDDRNTFRLTISKQRSEGLPRQRAVVGLVMPEAENVPLSGGKRLSGEDMYRAISQLAGQIERIADGQLNQFDILGVEDDDLETARKNLAELSAARTKRGGYTEFDNYQTYLIERAVKEMRRRIREKEKEQAQEAAPPPEDVPEIREEAAEAVPEAAVEQAEAEQGPQPWLDMEREEAYDNLREVFHSIMGEEGGVEDKMRRFREWWLEFSNVSFERAGVKPLADSDVDSLFLGEFKSQSASDIAGKEIYRPMITYTSIREYQEFSRRMQGEAGLGSRGMQISGDAFPPESAFHKTGLLVGFASREFISHEIRHSIDPHVNKREGGDWILAETLAYYHDAIVDAEGPIEDRFRQLALEIGQDIYYEAYAGDEEEPMSEEEFKRYCGDICAALQTIREQRGDVETQRLIASAKTVKELLQAVEKE